MRRVTVRWDWFVSSIPEVHCACDRIPTNHTRISLWKSS